MAYWDTDDGLAAGICLPSDVDVRAPINIPPPLPSSVLSAVPAPASLSSSRAVVSDEASRPVLDATLAAAMQAYGKSKWHAAREGFDRAVALAREMDDEEDLADALRLLAETHLKLPTSKEARACVAEARAIAVRRQQDDPLRLAACDETLGSCDAAENRWDAASNNLRTALAAYRAHDDVGGQSSCLGNLGQALLDAGTALAAAAADENNEANARHAWQRAAEVHFDEALTCFRERVALAERHPETGEGKRLGRVYAGMAAVHTSLGAPVQAIELSEKALVASVRSGDYAQELSSLASLANGHEHMGLGGAHGGGMRSTASAAEFRRKLFEILWKRHSCPTPTHCVVCAEPMEVFDATEVRSELRDEIFVLPSCLHTLHTRCLEKWRSTPYRSSVLSPLARAPNACPVCEDPNREHRKTREMDAWHLSRLQIGNFDGAEPGPLEVAKR